jgi:hypothetical protein
MASEAALRLSPQEREFLELHVIDGLPIYRAYEKAYRRFFITTRGQVPVPTSLARLGRSVLDKPASIAYIDELKAKLADRALQKRFLSFDEKRAFLADVVRAKAGIVDGTDAVVQEFKVNSDGTTTVKLPSKLQALEIDSRLMGEFKDSVQLEVSEKVLEFSKSFI